MTAAAPATRRRPTEVDVVFVGIALVLAGTGFRVWALHGAWFFYDDFYFIQRAISHNPTPAYLLTPYNGHLMPGGVLLSWLNAQIDPMSFLVPATEMVALFAVAGLGLLRLLLRLFGPRWAILVPLTVFLFSPILLPATTWWAAAVNQLPMLVALILGLDQFVAYLQRPTRVHLIGSVTWMVLGLMFVERTLLGFGVLWLVALMYFATGPLPDRLREVWGRYRTAFVTHAVLALAYVAWYVPWALNFDARTVIKRPFFEVIHDLAITAFSSGFIGGPVDWQVSKVTQSEAHPPQLVLLLGWATLAGLVIASARTRERGLRAWLLPTFVLAANIALLSVSRTIYFGPEIALDYRFQTEAALAAALALGLAFLPVLGARESSAPAQGTDFRIDTRGWAVTGCVGFVILATVSTSRFPLRNLTDASPRAYYSQVESSTRQHPHAQLLDLQVPPWLWAPLAFPTNTYSHMFAPLHTDLRIGGAITDTGYLVDDTGRFREVAFTSARAIERSPGRTKGCANVVPLGTSTWLLDGPVFGFGWFARLRYDASQRATLTLTTDGHSHRITLLPGRHTALVGVTGQFGSVVLQQSVNAESFCLKDLEIGQISPGR